jgi:hypothetical protein
MIQPFSNVGAESDVASRCCCRVCCPRIGLYRVVLSYRALNDDVCPSFHFFSFLFPFICPTSLLHAYPAPREDFHGTMLALMPYAHCVLHVLRCSTVLMHAADKFPFMKCPLSQIDCGLAKSMLILSIYHSLVLLRSFLCSFTCHIITHNELEDLD